MITVLTIWSFSFVNAHAFIVLNIHETPNVYLKPSFHCFRPKIGVEISEVRWSISLVNFSSARRWKLSTLILWFYGDQYSIFQWTALLFSWQFVNESKRKRSCIFCCYEIQVHHILILTYPHPNPDTSVDRVQPQISQMKNNLKGAAKSHGSAQNNISNRHADYQASSFSHDEKAIRAELKTLGRVFR